MCKCSMQTSLDLNPDYLIQNERGVSNNRQCKKLKRRRKNTKRRKKKRATTRISNVKINQERGKYSELGFAQ